MAQVQDLASMLLAGSGSNTASLVADCVKVIEEQVANKSGLSGMAIKAAYGLVSKISPGMIPDAMTNLLPDFVKQLQPLFAQHMSGAAGSAATAAAGAAGFGDFLKGQPGNVAEALLGITDARAAKSTATTLKAAYDQLRPKAKEYVEEAVPSIATMLTSYLTKPGKSASP